MTFSEAIEKFVRWKRYNARAGTVETYAKNLKFFGLFMRDCHIEDVTHEDILSYLDTMSKMGWDRNGFLIRCMAIKKFFEFFRRQARVLDPSLIPMPEIEYKFPKMMTEEEHLRMLATVPDGDDPTDTRNRAIMCLLWDTGMRVGELIDLNVSDIDLARMKAVIKTKKSRGIRPIRQVMWTKETNALLGKWIRMRSTIEPLSDPDALFIGARNKYVGRRLMHGGILKITYNASKAANLGYQCNPHRYRHAFGRDLAMKGANNSVISTLMGHSHMESSYVYTVLNDKAMEEQYTKYRRS